MSESYLNSLIAESGPVLEGFLGMLLSQDASVETESPEEVKADAITENTSGFFTAVSKTEGPHAFAVQIQAEWVANLAQAMLGMEMGALDDGAGDLISELVSQGYGSLRNSLSEGGHLPEMYFQIYAPEQEIDTSVLAEDLFKIPVSASLGDAQRTLTLFISSETAKAIEALNASQAEPEPVSEPVPVSNPQFPDFGKEQILRQQEGNFALLAEVELTLTVELGRRRIPLSEVLQLMPGSVIELEKLVGEPLEIYANGRLIAEGEAVVVDEQFGVRITNLSSAKLRSKVAA